MSTELVKASPVIVLRHRVVARRHFPGVPKPAISPAGSEGEMAGMGE